ncbi:MAG TPA: NHL repeat-containing protein, partial [Solirubrobacterales bacterium]
MSRAIMGVAAISTALLALPGSVNAAAPELLMRIPGDQVTRGGGAGELNHPRGIAADAVTGHIFIAELNNHRVSEYTAWGLFVKAWGWGVADGSQEFQICGPAVPEENPDPSLCQEGLPGDGKGQLDPFGVAIDPLGNIYVSEVENLRVQKFSPQGKFLVMFGGDVNRTKVEGGGSPEERNVCPIAPTDVCQGGTSGEGPSQLSGSVWDLIDYSPVGGGAIVVGDKDGIQVFDLDGTYRETILFTGPLAAFAGRSVNALDVDGGGNIYVTLSGLEDIYKLSPTGAPLDPGEPGESSFRIPNPLAVAVDTEGKVFGVDAG